MRRIVSIIAVGLVMSMRCAIAQQPPPDQTVRILQSDSDPTRPVFLSVRPEFYRVDEGLEQHVLIGRFDTAVLPQLRFAHGAPGGIVRIELPFSATDSGRRTAAGLGDLYAQMFVVPYRKGHFAWALGSGLIAPTATDATLGTGKWVAAPVAAPVWRYPGAMFLVKVQNFTSVAGAADRPDINYLLITPTFVHVIGREWWFLVDTETRTTWTDEGRTGVKSGLQVGARVAPGVGLWVKPEAWWGANRGGRWNLKFGLVWYQRRQ